MVIDALLVVASKVQIIMILLNEQGGRKLDNWVTPVTMNCISGSVTGTSWRCYEMPPWTRWWGLTKTSLTSM